jgi:ABC-2 type transport system ATP-binding protein
MSNYSIETIDLTKKYGNKVAVNHINLKVPKGSFYAFLGRNGAGKSTTIKMLMELLSPTSGSIEVLSGRPGKNFENIRERIGYVSENQIMYQWMTIEESIMFCRSFYDHWDSKLCDELIARFKLNTKSKLKSLSRGMYAQVALILAIAHRPELLILDDPMLGLDTIVRKEFMEEIIGVLNEQECTVFFSTHIINEIEFLADYVGIMKAGDLIVSLPVEEVKQSVKQIRMIFDGHVPELSQMENILGKSISQNEIVLTVKDCDDTEVAKFQKLNPKKLDVIDLTLEEIFVAIA